jgi:hypothetical protein
MENYAPSAWAEIISKAAISPLGVAALVSLIVGFVVLALFFRSDKAEVRLGAVALLMVFCAVLMFAAIYSARPVAPSATIAAGAASAAARASSSVLPSPPPASTAAATVATPSTSPASSAAGTTRNDPPVVVVAPAPRTDCGARWSGWIEVGGAVGNPCPPGCSRGAELGQSYRVVGFPPRPQTQHNFQCWRE